MPWNGNERSECHLGPKSLAEWLEHLTNNSKVATVPGFDSSILRHSGIWVPADETVLNKVKITKVAFSLKDQSWSNWERRKMTEIMARNKEAKQAAIRLRRELKELQVIIFDQWCGSGSYYRKSNIWRSGCAHMRAREAAIGSPLWGVGEEKSSWSFYVILIFKKNVGLHPDLGLKPGLYSEQQRGIWQPSFR